MARTLTERAALREIYGIIESSLRGGDLEIQIVENRQDEDPNLTDDDIDYLVVIAHRVADQMANKRYKLLGPPRKRK